MFEEEAEAVRSVAEQAGHGVVVTRRPWCWGRKVWKAVHSCGHGVVKGGIVFRDGVVRAPAVRAEMMTVNACLSAPVFGVGWRSRWPTGFWPGAAGRMWGRCFPFRWRSGVRGAMWDGWGGVPCGVRVWGVRVLRRPLGDGLSGFGGFDMPDGGGYIGCAV